MGQRDALAVGNTAADFDAGDGTALTDLGDDEPELAVIDQNSVIRLDRLEDLGVREIDAVGIARRRIRIENEGLTVLQFGRVADEGAEPQLRSLEIHEDADRALGFALDGTDHLDPLGELLTSQMAHIDAEHVRTGVEQLLDHFRRIGCRAEGGDDLGAARALQWSLQHPLDPLVADIARGNGPANARHLMRWCRWPDGGLRARSIPQPRRSRPHHEPVS